MPGTRPLARPLIPAYGAAGLRGWRKAGNAAAGAAAYSGLRGYGALEVVVFWNWIRNWFGVRGDDKRGVRLYNLRVWLLGLPRIRKRGLLAVGDLLVTVAAAYCTAFLQGVAAAALWAAWWWLPLLCAIVVACAYAFGLYRAVIRYIAVRVALRTVLAAVTAAALVGVAQAVAGTALFASAGLINLGLLLLLGLGGTRFLARHFLTHYTDADAERLLVYGAGDAGAAAARGLAADPRRRVVAFLDDRSELAGNRVADLPVYPASQLPELVRSKGIDSVVLALPSISRQRRQEIVTSLEPYPLTVRTVPSLQEILSGHATLSEVRDIDIDDLLGRDPVPPQQDLLTASITGQTVLVTGAGGSIGGELCRQIVTLQPRRLVLFELNELALYEVERDARRLLAPAQETEIIPVLGSVVDGDRLEHCLRRFAVQTVYHAAAYKHVPLVEQNVSAGLRNNAIGTWRAAQAALAAKVGRFILISTDKAVRPSNVMGATKRVAELVVQAHAKRCEGRVNGDHCVFTMVRFGNVLGSSGSVVPQFRAQIEAGGPVTVTHPDINRFFMTVQEAAQLVIQAGGMARGGEVFVLDMGEPVRIFDLAKRMIRLAGYSVQSESDLDGDIDIQFTGLRPGEKLYEELLVQDDTTPTAHPKIRCAREAGLAWKTLVRLLNDMEAACAGYRRGAVKALLQQAVSEYTAAREDHDALCDADEPEIWHRPQAQLHDASPASG